MADNALLKNRTPAIGAMFTRIVLSTRAALERLERKDRYGKGIFLATSADLRAFDLDDPITTRAKGGSFAMIAVAEKRIWGNPPKARPTC